MPQSNYWPFTCTKGREEAGTTVLQKQLGDMEGEVKEIQMELAAIRSHRKEVKTYARRNLQNSSEEDLPKDIFDSHSPALNVSEEKYSQRFSEIAKLREELIKAKNSADEEKIQREKYESKLKDLEIKLDKISCSDRHTESKDYKSKNDSDCIKSQLREYKEENEELKISLTERDEQLQEYRVKYLQAQQQVEELRRQQDIIEFDNKQVSEQIQLEIQKVKMQFQEKLQELAPLPDLLKGAQIQLQEAKQLQRLAEENSQQLSNELHRVKEKLVTAVSNLSQEKIDKTKALDECKDLAHTLDEKQKEIDELYKNLDEYKCRGLRLKEKLMQQEVRYDEKTAECSNLMKDVDELRDEHSRSIARCKERADSMRRYLQTQVSELERQLIQSRAQCRSCQKERDEIRQRMQIQINSLQENFELVEIKLRTLQGQVTSLKNTYTQMLVEEEENMEFKIEPVMM